MEMMASALLPLIVQLFFSAQSPSEKKLFADYLDNPVMQIAFY